MNYFVTICEVLLTVFVFNGPTGKISHYIPYQCKDFSGLISDLEAAICRCSTK